MTYTLILGIEDGVGDDGNTSVSWALILLAILKSWHVFRERIDREMNLDESNPSL